MSGEITALLAAACFGATSVLLKKGYKNSNVLTGILIVLLVNMIVMWTIVLVTAPLQLFLTQGVFYFIIGGILAQTMARSLQYKGIDKVGPSRNHTILGAIPLFAAFFAFFILGEKLTAPIVLGTLLIVLGVIVLMYEKNKTQWKAKDLIFPFSAAVLYGFVSVIQKTGFQTTPNAFVAAATSLTTAFVIVYLFTAARKQFSKVKPGPSLRFFMLAGIFNTAAFFLLMYSLQKGNVTIIMPLAGTQALFGTLFSYLFLKGLDKVTINVVVGAVVVIIGAAFIAMA